MAKACSNCGHIIGDRCNICGKEYMCGVVSEECKQCCEMVLAAKYENETEKKTQKWWLEIGSSYA